jgi:uncharacterized protein YbaR (Trm112 family)
MMTTDLLNILRCPETRSELSEAPLDIVARINSAIREGRLVNRAGNRVEQPIDGGLMRTDGAVLYPIIDHIPVLLQGDGISLDQLSTN